MSAARLLLGGRASTGRQAPVVCGFGARGAAPLPLPATVIYIKVDSFPFPVNGLHVPLQASSLFVIAGLLFPLLLPALLPCNRFVNSE